MHHQVLEPHPLWLFEENYLLLRRLFPALDSGKRLVYSAGHQPHELQLVVGECSRYTTTFTLTTNFSASDRLMPPQILEVRVYHDARLAEVIGYQTCRNIPPPYAASPDKGFVRDERQQVNRLLFDLLRHCRAQGYTARVESDRADA